MIIQPGTLKPGIIRLKAEWFNQVKPAARICTQPDDIAGIRRDFRLVQYKIKHLQIFGLNRFYNHQDDYAYKKKDRYLVHPPVVHMAVCVLVAGKTFDDYDAPQVIDNQ